MKNTKEIADKFFEEQEKLNISYDSREAFIEGFKLAKEMEKEQIMNNQKGCVCGFATTQCTNVIVNKTRTK